MKETRVTARVQRWETCALQEALSFDLWRCLAPGSAWGAGRAVDFWGLGIDGQLLFQKSTGSCCLESREEPVPGNSESVGCHLITNNLYEQKRAKYITSHSMKNNNDIVDYYN